MRAIDTNVLVRLLVRDDAKQAEAAEAFVSTGAWISSLVLAETLWVLGSYYGRSRKEIAAIVEQIINGRSIIVQDAGIVGAALELFRENKNVSFSDCLVLTMAEKAGHKPLGTFDRNLAKLDGVQRL